jgi:hypothetical protein
MNTHSLHHFIYTNAAGPGGTGYRFVKRPTAWQADQSRRVENWIETLDARRLDSGQRGFATVCLRVANRLHVLLAVTYAGFALDAHGRPGGLLTHGLAVPVEEGSDSGLHIAALLDKAAALRRPGIADAERLEVYLDAYTRDEALIVAPPSLAHLQALRPEVLQRILTVAGASCTGTAFAEMIPLAVAQPERALAYGAAALPPRLRLAFSWGYELVAPERPSFSAAGTGGRTIRFPLAEAYSEWLQRCLNSNDPSALEEQVWTNWEIRSWQDLLRSIQ